MIVAKTMDLLQLRFKRQPPPGAHVARGRVLMSSSGSLYCFRSRASLALWNGGKMRRAGSHAACSSALRGSRRPVPMWPVAAC